MTGGMMRDLYAAEDFAHSRFAHRGDELATRDASNYEFARGEWQNVDGESFTDGEMAAGGWVPVVEVLPDSVTDRMVEVLQGAIRGQGAGIVQYHHARRALIAALATGWDRESGKGSTIGSDGASANIARASEWLIEHVNLSDAEDCEACAEVQDRECAVHHGFMAAEDPASGALGLDGVIRQLEDALKAAKTVRHQRSE